MVEFDIARTRKTLFGALLDARDKFGRNKEALEDLERQPITFGRLVLGSLVLGRKLAGLTREREYVGVLLPNVQAIAVTLFGLNAFGRVPAFLNFTAGLKNLKAACELAGIEDDHHLPPLRRAGQARRCRRSARRGAADPVARGCSRRPDELRQAARAVRFLVRAACPRPGEAPARRSGRAALHLGIRGRAEGRGAVERQSRRQRLSGQSPRRRRAAGRRRLLQSAADLPLLRPDRGASDGGSQRHEVGALSEPAPLPADPEARRRHARHDHARDGHLPAGLCARGRRERSGERALCHCRGGAGEGRDPQALGEARHRHPGRLWRHGMLAGHRRAACRTATGPVPSGRSCRESNGVSNRSRASTRAGAFMCAARTS